MRQSRFRVFHYLVYSADRINRDKDWLLTTMSVVGHGVTTVILTPDGKSRPKGSSL